MNVSAERLLEEFRDEEYRHAYVDDFLNTSIATQVKVLREQRGWKQADLAARCGMVQSRISVLENVNYSSWSISTLRRLARAFDVVLTVKFDSFGKRLRDIERFSRDSLEVPSFDDEFSFAEDSATDGQSHFPPRVGYPFTGWRGQGVEPQLPLGESLSWPGLGLAELSRQIAERPLPLDVLGERSSTQKPWQAPRELLATNAA